MDPIYVAYINERNRMIGLGSGFWEDIVKKYVEPLYKERNEIVPKKIKDHLEKTLKGKIINANPISSKPVENAKVIGISVTYRRPERNEFLPSNINYDVIIYTDKGNLEMLARNWEEDIEIVG